MQNVFLLWEKQNALGGLEVREGVEEAKANLKSWAMKEERHTEDVWQNEVHTWESLKEGWLECEF